MVSYEKRTLKLCLVSVNNSVSPDAGYVQSEINKIYRQAVVSWEVTSLKDGISVTLPRNNQKQLDNTDTNNQMDYTPEMKLVYNAMKNNPAYDKHTITCSFSMKVPRILMAICHSTENSVLFSNTGKTPMNISTP
ncbi:MAG: hypothetical protein HC830_08740 [Bacteroidetes bacterium]|nr:hypothetical protein [Bacteroidota bacterium]